MKFAIYVPNLGTFGDVQNLVDLAQAAEASVLLQPYTSAGVTWWLESFWANVSLDNVKAVVNQRPPHAQ